MSDELLNRGRAPSEPELEDETPYDDETIRAMIRVARDAFDFEKAGKMLAEHEPRTFLKMLQIAPKSFVASDFSGMGKIEAIKYIRSKNGMGLKEAKDLLDSIGGYLDGNGKTVHAHTLSADSLYGRSVSGD